jgi:trehalose 6-phosphate synthase/phosphatase
MLPNATFEDGRVIVVSNRLPLTLKRAGGGWRTERSAGGLATAMQPILKRTHGIWIGWSGDASTGENQGRQDLLDRWRRNHGYIALDLPPNVASGFYEGYANQTLWPLFHQFTSKVSFDSEHWRAYSEANLRFRDAILEHLQPNDTVWIHDYQLMLLPQLLREAAPDARIGFFLHIPFPSSAVFRLLPRREQLLRGLLGADYLAFHTHSYLQHFRHCLLRILGMDSEMDRVDIGGRFVRLDALPIGIATREFDRLMGDQSTIARTSELRARFEGCQILLAVDRLDYTKGVPDRLRTYRRLLDLFPRLRGKVVLIQVAVPSREQIPHYRELRREVDQLVGRINGEYSSADWTPIVYLRRVIPAQELVALYAAADLAWVTPLRDGLNLVAKEYVACKRGQDGALVLSEFAGAATEMGEAFLVNPLDEERTAEVIEQALSITVEERRNRMAAMYRRVARNDVFVWGERFLDNLKKAVANRAEWLKDGPPRLPIDEAVAAFKSARTRLLLLDYDGTLVGYASRPDAAVPPQSLVDLLTRLASSAGTTIAVVSGRRRYDLEHWFGEVQGLWLAAEHGGIVRPAGASEWQTIRPHQSDDWKKRVGPVLEHFVDRTPGSFVEEKELSLVWHYRMSDPEFGDWLGNELVANLEQMLAETELRAYRGQKSVEVKPLWANKGTVLSLLSEVCSNPEFALAAGDDRTDEDLFAQLPPEAWTIHVGRGRSRARFRLPEPEAMVSLLEAIAKASRAAGSIPG